MIAHIRALRPHQWLKNGFVLAALVFAHRLTDGAAILRTLVAFAAFCAVASAVYLINDVADYERDRHHERKRHRPVAAGLVARRTALVIAGTLAPAGLAAGWWLNTATAVVLGIYFVMNLLYSSWLKHVVLLDVFIIAIGFLLRVVAGAVAIEVGISAWLLVCTFFLALFMALCKRRAEGMVLGDEADAHRSTLGDYGDTFVDKAVSALAAMTVMSYALYTIDPAVMHRLGTDALVATVPLVLFGVLRYLFLVHERGLGGSPTRLLLRDRGMQAVVTLWLGVTIGAIYWGVQLGLIYAGRGQPLP